MINACGEVDLGWLEWVVCWEMDCKEEDTALEWTVTLNYIVSGDDTGVASDLLGP